MNTDSFITSPPATSIYIQPPATCIHLQPTQFTKSVHLEPAAPRYRFLLLCPLVVCAQSSFAPQPSYPVLDTMQDRCFDTAGMITECPGEGEALYGLDAHYSRLASSYTDKDDGTVTDENIRLIWQRTPENERLQFADAIAYCEALELGGRSDWRVPTIKELYSLADFRDELLKPEEGEPTPCLDTSVFDFEYPQGQMAFAGQYWSNTLYVKGPIINGQNRGAFGFNFANGHINTYGTCLNFFTGEASTSSGLPTDVGQPPGDYQGSGVNQGPSGGDQAPGNFVRCVSGEAQFPTDSLLARLHSEFSDIAETKGLSLRIVPGSAILFL